MAASSSPNMVRGLQERAARALPAEHVEHAGGWWLRHAPSCAWWVGTVLPHGEAEPGELVRRVVDAEEFYARRGAATRFQISPRACPGDLDTLLAKRGYRRESPMSLQAAATARVLERAPAGALRVDVHDRPTDGWFEVWHAVHGHGGDPRSERDMLGHVQRPSAYAAATIGDDIVAVGRSVADGGWAGVFGMATLPRARGKGAAREVLAVLAGWAGAHGADRMYLQVESGNVPAVRLYGRVGFEEVCGYHYRTVNGRHSIGMPTVTASRSGRCSRPGEGHFSPAGDRDEVSDALANSHQLHIAQDGECSWIAELVKDLPDETSRENLRRSCHRRGQSTYVKAQVAQ